MDNSIIFNSYISTNKQCFATKISSNKFLSNFLLDDSCQLTPANKPFCKKCRYDKCILVGMNPTNILTDEEKRVRFRKYFKKKDELRSSTAATTATTASSSTSVKAPTKKYSSRTIFIRTEPRKILPK
jgi:hypothetical protein